MGISIPDSLVTFDQTLMIQDVLNAENNVMSDRVTAIKTPGQLRLDVER